MSETAVADNAVKISCTKKDCEADLHCYRPKRGEWEDPTGECQGCGDRSVDWDRVRRRDMSDFAALEQELRHEWIRHYFWTKPLDEKSIDRLASTTVPEFRSAVHSLLKRKIGIPTPFRDGMQTPLKDEKLSGHPIYYAQHATATCCKKCVYYWWGFDRTKELTEGQLDFLTELCVHFFQSRDYLVSDG